MNALTGRWRVFAGAMVALISAGISAGPAQAAEVEELSSAVTADLDGFASLELELGLGTDDEIEALPLAQYAPAPPPPRGGGYRWYRPYRPHWHYRIVPPPIFAPGWFGLYFLGSPPPPPPAQPAPPPEKVEKPDFRHINDYSLGVTFGGYNSAYKVLNGFEYWDPGVRFTLDYRHTPTVGWQLAAGFYGSNMRLDGQGSTDRMDIPIALSAVLHAFPRSPIQPYFLFGGTGNVRTYNYIYDDGTIGEPYSELRVGAHAGAGLELLVGDRTSIVVEGRRTWYTLVDRAVVDQTFQRDRMVSGGLLFYF